MRDGITYRGSANLGEPSLEEPDYGEEEIDAELAYLASTPEGLGLEPVEGDAPVYFRLADVIEQIHQDERAKVERRREGV